MSPGVTEDSRLKQIDFQTDSGDHKGCREAEYVLDMFYDIRGIIVEDLEEDGEIVVIN